MYNCILKFFIFYVLLHSIHCCGDHYWRDYEGIIPDDAIPAGKNSQGLSYVGQAYIHKFGLLFGTIIPGKWEVQVPCYGVKKTEAIIKILCAKDKSKYNWIPTNLSNYKKDTHGKCPVNGGYDQVAAENFKMSVAPLHIGRTRQHSDVIIGNIAIYDKANPWFYYPFNDEEIRAFDYEVLVYNGDNVQPR